MTDTPPATGADGPDRPIFVVGCARSGTTMLQLMLHAHPRIAIPPETRHLVEIYHRRVEFGDLRDPANVEAVIDWIPAGRRKRSFGDLGVDVEDLRTRAHAAEPPTMGTIGGLVLQMYAERWGKPRWGDKRPSYFMWVDDLLAMFPDAQIVHLVRDGRDCVASLKHMGFWGSGSIGAMCNWVAAMRFGARARRRLRDDQYIELHYEDLVTESRAELTRLCDFLGEEFDEAMLEPNRVARRAVPRRKRKRHHVRTTDAVDDAAVGRGAQELEPWELTLFEAVAGRHLRAHGYELTAGRRPVPPPKPLARYLRQASRVRWRELTRRVEEHRRRRAYPHPVAARLTSAQRRAAGTGA